MDGWKVCVCRFWMDRWIKGACMWMDGRKVRTRIQVLILCLGLVPSHLQWYLPFLLKIPVVPAVSRRLTPGPLQLLGAPEAKALLGNPATDGSKSCFMLPSSATVTIPNESPIWAVVEFGYSSKTSSFFPQHHFPIPWFLVFHCKREGNIQDS